MKLQNIRNLSRLVLTDFISVTLLYYIIKYSLNKIRNFYNIIQSMGVKVDELSFALQKNASLLDINELSGRLDLISELGNKILLLFLVLFAASFLIYTISQSINWNLVLNNFKLKDYKKYLKKSALINIILFPVYYFLFFKLIVNARVFILNFWFENIFDSNLFLVILLILFLLAALFYLSFLTYILLNNHSLKEALNRLTKVYYQKPVNFLVYLSGLFFSFLVSIFILRINPNSVILTMISFIIFLSGFNLLRVYLARKLEFL
ncbi:hypothetical protein HYX16_00595 [Candidatus Woesearchaeota archaeon]|nr:hypothetical protein [Candidatus Woesearchaeota archaeon]